MKTQVVRARVSEETFANLHKEKEEKGYSSISAILRDKLDNEARDERVFSDFRQELVVWNRNMAAVGNNLNQIAHNLNAFLPAEADDILNEFSVLHTLLFELKREVNKVVYAVNHS